MSQDDNDSLKNAVEIIERFGGIRPMASKVGAAVTTVQGWKKRDVIPAARRADVLLAANENNIDLSDLVEGFEMPKSAGVAMVEEAVAKNPISAFVSVKDEPQEEAAKDAAGEGGNVGAEKSANKATGKADKKEDEARGDVKDEIKDDIKIEPLLKPQPKPMPQSLMERSEPSHEELMAAIAAGQKKAVNSSLWAAATFVVVFSAGAAFYLWPSAQKIQKIDQQETQIASLENKVGAIDDEVQEMNETAGLLRGLVPEEMQLRMNELRQEAENIQQRVIDVAVQAEDIHQRVLSTEAGTLSDRLSVLEAKFSEIEGGQALADLTARIRTLESGFMENEQLSAAVDELRKIVDSIDGQVHSLDSRLAEAQTAPESDLGQTLEGVSGGDLKAAAMLIAFAQLRESLHRNAPFENDLALLQKLAGDSDPELQAALTRLAPQAQKGGVLTTDGLSTEFRSLAGDIVFSSLQGEDVSITEKARVRLTEIVNIKKDGEVIGGNPTQQTVAQAQAQLDHGDVQGAIATLQSLDGEARDTALPFLEQAQATLLAEHVQNLLRQNILASVGSDVSTAAGQIGQSLRGLDASGVGEAIQGAVPGNSGTVVRDEESGLSILPSGPRGFRGLSPGNE